MKRMTGKKFGYCLNADKNEQTKISLGKKIGNDFASAWEEFRGFETAYRLLRPAGLAYLGKQSALYKKAVMKLQGCILPVVREQCPTCPSGTCCRLNAPDLQIYIAKSVGGFNFVDYLLARHGCDFPAPDLSNARGNLCVFWEKGCRLDSATRSLLCLQYFCPSLRRELDMDLVELRLGKIRSIVNGFSLARLFK